MFGSLHIMSISDLILDLLCHKAWNVSAGAAMVEKQVTRRDAYASKIPLRLSLGLRRLAYTEKITYMRET